MIWQFQRHTPLAQHRACRAGFGCIRPIAVVPAGCAALHDDKLALVALGVIDIVKTIGIAAVVYNLVGAVRLTLNFVLVISACRDIALPNHIPLKNLKLGVALMRCLVSLSILSMLTLPTIRRFSLGSRSSCWQEP